MSIITAHQHRHFKRKLMKLLKLHIQMERKLRATGILSLPNPKRLPQ